MEKELKNPSSILGKKRKRKLSTSITASEPKVIKVEALKSKDAPKQKKKKKKAKATITEHAPTVNEIVVSEIIESPEPLKPKKENDSVQKPLPAVKGLSIEEMGKKYPVLINKELIDRFLKVTLNNNQKGRIRQAIRGQLQGSDSTLSADVINGKIQAILKNSENLTDSDLRRVRILHNMLRTSLEPEKEKVTGDQKKKKVKKPKKEKAGVEPKKENVELESMKENGEDEPMKENGEVEPKNENGVKPKKEKPQNKVKGPKRYVVFIGNLPLDIDKEKLMKHFAEIDEHIKDIRIPKQAEDKKSAIAFIEVTTEPVYEMALSKHHSMLDNKRINVMYTAQENGKVSKSEAKGKAAKLVALQKSGKLVGSTAAGKKRSHRRNIMKKAKAKQTALENA